MMPEKAGRNLPAIRHILLNLHCQTYIAKKPSGNSDFLIQINILHGVY